MTSYQETPLSRHSEAPTNAVAFACRCRIPIANPMGQSHW